ncbi:MAG: ABC transporter permease [Planctomycetes bacterium]|nr:ABC transporter permease [Planctomycetota bacterium]
MNIRIFARKYAIIGALLLIIIFFSLATPKFLTLSNLMNVARQVSMVGVASVGMLLVILLGGIDLSVGSSISLVNVTCALLMVRLGLPPVAAAVLSVLLATLFGFINGLLITRIKIPAIISSMAFMNILSGIAFLLTSGMTVYGFPNSFKVLGQGYVWFIPIPVIVMVAMFALGAFILNKTVFGRYVYAIGGNEEAAKLSGVNVNVVKNLVYTLCGTFAGIAGLIMLSRLGTGQASVGTGFEFQVIIAVVLGGTSVAGGAGKISGVIIGVLIMGVLSNGLMLLNVSTYAQLVINGIVLLIAVGIDCVSKMNKDIKLRNRNRSGENAV